MPTTQQRRARRRGLTAARPEVLALSAAHVLDQEGRRSGHVHDVYLSDADGRLEAVALRMGWWRPRQVLIPAEALMMDEHGHLRVAAPRARIRRGPEAPVNGHLPRAALDEARVAFTRDVAPQAEPAGPAEPS
ncbi:PRC-barrel domain-containing protein [Brachybacterium sp. EF45031]|uniref:PRC-barrel domain-containing protein n=1 Tax=Brachybacterium sillae TaxID=2810536 RepID=UPI00217EE9A0|nr:PRC-barrel domain-containing protein [Brachybacterium sillae]MCS6711489.1 PRC-barrel domain-containing protein [Brachybacterium sillae]